MGLEELPLVREIREGKSVLLALQAPPGIKGKASLFSLPVFEPGGRGWASWRITRTLPGNGRTGPLRAFLFACVLAVSSANQDWRLEMERGTSRPGGSFERMRSGASVPWQSLRVGPRSQQTGWHVGRFSSPTRAQQALRLADGGELPIQSTSRKISRCVRPAHIRKLAICLLRKAAAGADVSEQARRQLQNAVVNLLVSIAAGSCAPALGGGARAQPWGLCCVAPCLDQQLSAPQT